MRRDLRFNELDRLIAAGVEEPERVLPKERNAPQPIRPPLAAPRERVYRPDGIKELRERLRLIERRLDEQALFLNAVLERYRIGPMSECALGLSGERKPSDLRSERERERERLGIS